MFRALLVPCFVFVSTGLALGVETFVVSTDNDAGPGSLRQAITDANAQPGADIVRFDIPGTGVQTITLLTALPDITDGVNIDGTTQPGFNSTPVIELTAGPGLAADGLRVLANGTTVTGLIINRFQNGISVGPYGDVHIFNCYIGTDKTGTQAAPNERGILVSQAGQVNLGGVHAGFGNLISGNRLEAIKVSQADPDSTETNTIILSGNYIGTDKTGTQAVPNCTATADGTAVAAAVVVDCRYARVGDYGASDLTNVISGNMADGIFVRGTGAVVAGNYVGTSASGDNALPNTGAGITVEGSGVTVGAIGFATLNLVSGNIGPGIVLPRTSDHGTVIGNLVGTDLTGKFALPNGGDGILIRGSNWHVIGGSYPGAGNVISGNAGSGIALLTIPPARFQQPFSPNGNIIQGNLIGTDITGGAAVPNGGDGVLIGASAFVFYPYANTIGGPMASARNVISGNLGNGVQCARWAKATRIEGNFIGTAADGTTALGNGENGILLIDPFENSIGSISGPNTEAANTIAFNLGNGVATREIFFGRAERISANSIHDNGLLGIDLSDDGPTPNDPGDEDGGPDFQNFPVITEAFGNNGNLTVYGTLNSAASESFTLEFFASPAADSSGFGEGQVFLGQANVTTNASGDAVFNVTFPLPSNVTVVSSTALGSIGHTSEFSAAAPISPFAPGLPPTDPTPVLLPTHADRLLNISTRLRVEPGDHALIEGFIVTGVEPKRVIIRGLGPSLAQFRVPGVLSDPVLRVFRTDVPFTDPRAFVGENDNWASDQQTEIDSSGLAPSNGLESAMIRTLEPGFYGAVLSGNGDGTGIGVIEVYDLSGSANSLLANISTRGFVTTNDNVMIAGFIIGGDGHGGTTVVIRGIGPSLKEAIPDAMTDPRFDVHDANGNFLAESNDWRGDLNAEFVRATGLAPADEREAALYLSLPAGNYTAVLRGSDSTVTGSALVEIFDVGH